MYKFIVLLSCSFILVAARPEGDSFDSDAENIETDPVKTTILPFYGGAKGQSLEIIEYPDGRVVMNIIKSPLTTESPKEELTQSPEEIENPSIPSRYDLYNGHGSLKDLIVTSERMLELEEKAKSQIPLTKDEQKEFQNGIKVITESASKLALFQEKDNQSPLDSKLDSADWWEKRKIKKEQNKTVEEESKKKEEDENRNKNKQDKGDNEKNKGQSQGGDTDEVSVNLPSEDASVAEAKPVGLAVAGEGGVAASRPIASAISGRGGLAVARPVGTAIAGVDPDEALYLINGPGGSIRPSGEKDKGKNKPKTKNTEVIYRLIQKYQNV